MTKRKYSKEELQLLNSQIGLRMLLKKKHIDIDDVIKQTRYRKKLKEKQQQLIELQNWVIKNEQKVVVLFEGRDAAGKGGAIRRITEYINPRHFRTVALDIPTYDESKQWFFQRYINQLPKPGEIVFFDRSWYNRAVVEPVNQFCTKSEYKIFMSEVNDFERMLIHSNTFLIKLFFSITKDEQARRFKQIKSSPLKRWKMTPVDENAQNLWKRYTTYEKKMLSKTHTKKAPWKIIDANDKTGARLEALDEIIGRIPYQSF